MVKKKKQENQIKAIITLIFDFQDFAVYTLVVFFNMCIHLYMYTQVIF